MAPSPQQRPESQVVSHHGIHGCPHDSGSHPGPVGSEAQSKQAHLLQQKKIRNLMKAHNQWHWMFPEIDRLRRQKACDYVIVNDQVLLSDGLGHVPHFRLAQNHKDLLTAGRRLAQAA